MFRSECKIKHSADCDFIIGRDNKTWMQISAMDNEVFWKIFPCNIPKEFIGEKSQELTALTYSMVCGTREDAIQCKHFISDFIDCGYGEKYCNGDGWMLAMDLQDIVKFLAEKNCYRELICDSPEFTNTILNFFKKDDINNAKEVLICVRNGACDENALLAYNAVMENLGESILENRVILHQCVKDNSIKNKILVSIIFN